jgi:hypothetical protein
VALVRAAHPSLTASQVVHRVEATADKQGGPPPDRTYGWGLINPSASVSRVLAEELPTVAPSVSAPAVGNASGGGGGHSSSTDRAVAVVLIVVIGLVVAAVFVFRVRHIVLASAGNGGQANGAGPQPPGRGDQGQTYGDWNDAGWSGDPPGANGRADIGAETARPVAPREP